ncbi:MAG: histone deacetylase family protein [Gammaproteobacteria bacterium]
MKTVLSKDHRLHSPRGELAGGELIPPYECPQRWDYVVDALRSRHLGELLEPQPLSMAGVQAVHREGFVRFLSTAWQAWDEEGFKGDAIPTVFPARRMRQREPDYIDGKLGYYCMAIETAITAGTWIAACSSAAVAQSAQRLVANGERAAFALCRPPGHHAASDLYGGYCFLNNAAIATQAFVDGGASRVAVLDVDFHHGNGTQDIFFDRSDVLYLSLHGRPEDAFPHFSGYADETGAGAGEGFNQNYPLSRGIGFDSWAVALEDACRRIERYSPEALVVSLGVDTFERDPISFFGLRTDDFSRYGERLSKLGLPTLFVMEGGYAVEEIGINTVNVLSGFEQG